MSTELVQVVTDSTAHMPATVARAKGVKAVPRIVRFGEEVLLDGVDLCKSSVIPCREGSVVGINAGPGQRDLLYIARQCRG